MPLMHVKASSIVDCVVNSVDSSIIGSLSNLNGVDNSIGGGDSNVDKIWIQLNQLNSSGDEENLIRLVILI